MRGTLASSERTVDVKTAIDEVQRVLRDAGKLNYRTPSGEFPHQSAASLIGKNGVIVASRGKGLGGSAKQAPSLSCTNTRSRWA